MRNSRTSLASDLALPLGPCLHVPCARGLFASLSCRVCGRSSIGSTNEVASETWTLDPATCPKPPVNVRTATEEVHSSIASQTSMPFLSCALRLILVVLLEHDFCRQVARKLEAEGGLHRNQPQEAQKAPVCLMPEAWKLGYSGFVAVGAGGDAGGAGGSRVSGQCRGHCCHACRRPRDVVTT